MLSRADHSDNDCYDMLFDEARGPPRPRPVAPKARAAIAQTPSPGEKDHQTLQDSANTPYHNTPCPVIMSPQAWL